MNGKTFFIIGILMILFAIALIIIFFAVWLTQYNNPGDSIPGWLWGLLIVAAIVLIIGIVFLLVGFSRKKKTKKNLMSEDTIF